MFVIELAVTENELFKPARTFLLVFTGVNVLLLIIEVIGFRKYHQVRRTKILLQNALYVVCAVCLVCVCSTTRIWCLKHSFVFPTREVKKSVNDKKYEKWRLYDRYMLIIVRTELSKGKLETALKLGA